MSSKYQKRLQEDNEFIYYKLTAGNYTTTIHYQDVLQGVKQAEPFTYPLQTEIREDVETQGNWPLKYGTAGYMLFNYDSVGTHIKKLPKYLENIVLSRNGNIHWSSTTTDIRALNAPEENAERKAGGIITNDPNVCQQTFTIDLKGKMEKKYSIVLDKRKFVDKYPVNAFGFTRLRIELYKGVIGTVNVHVSEKK